MIELHSVHDGIPQIDVGQIASVKHDVRKLRSLQGDLVKKNVLEYNAVEADFVRRLVRDRPLGESAVLERLPILHLVIFDRQNFQSVG
jgi:hypothetical protein